MNKVLIFTLGAAAGSLLTWKLLEEKYKKIADEEIESVKEHYKNRDRMISELANDENEYTNLVNDLKYAKEEDEENYTVKVELGEDYIKPLIISPEDFGDMPGYDTEFWTYYSDGILTNEKDEIITDPENIIGDALEHFGEYEDESVYVRNDNDKCDYEIIKIYSSFDNGVDS